MSRIFTEPQLADYLFDRIIVNCPKCPETDCLRVACQLVAAELLQDCEVAYKFDPVSDGGA
jgi:hypothetical protein